MPFPCRFRSHFPRSGSFDAGQLAGQYIGVLLIGAAGLSVGLFISSLSTNQITSFILGGLCLLVLTLAGQLPGLVSLPAWLGGLLGFLSFGFHFESFNRGIIDSRDVLYFVLVAALFLYLNTRVLTGRKSS